MGLENLKSVFADGAGVNKSQISGRYDGDKKVQPMEGILGNRTSAVDFFGGSNSYKPTLNPNIPKKKNRLFDEQIDGAWVIEKMKKRLFKGLY